MERFIGVIIEHFAGAFPLWLAPIQAKILPVATTFLEYGNQIYHILKQHNIRVQIDDSGDSLGKQIRNAELAKIPYMLVIGQQEVDTQTVTLRSYKTKEQVTSPLTDMIERLTEEYDQRSL